MSSTASPFLAVGPTQTISGGAHDWDIETVDPTKYSLVDGLIVTPGSEEHDDHSYGRSLACGPDEPMLGRIAGTNKVISMRRLAQVSTGRKYSMRNQAEFIDEMEKLGVVWTIGQPPPPMPGTAKPDPVLDASGNTPTSFQTIPVAVPDGPSPAAASASPKGSLVQPSDTQGTMLAPVPASAEFAGMPWLKAQVAAPSVRVVVDMGERGVVQIYCQHVVRPPNGCFLTLVTDNRFPGTQYLPPKTRADEKYQVTVFAERGSGEDNQMYQVKCDPLCNLSLGTLDLINLFVVE